MSKSPTAVVDHHVHNRSPPEWKKDLIRRIKIQKNTFIRLPNALLSPPPTSGVANKDLVAASAPTFNRSVSSTDVSSTGSGTVLRLSRDDIDGSVDGLNGIVKTKTDAPDGNAYSTIGDNASSLRSKQKAGSSNNELNGSRAWLSQLDVEGEKDAITSAKRQSNEVLLRVSEHKRGASSSGSEVFSAFVFGSASLQGLTTTPTQLKFLNSKDDAATGRKNNLGMGVKSNETVSRTNNGESLTFDFNGIDGVNGENDEANKNDRHSDGNEIDYGPGVVGRLREKFKSLASKGDEGVGGVPLAPVSPAPLVRRVASLELLDVVFDDEPSDAVSPGIARSGGDGLVGRTKGLYEKNSKNIASIAQFSKAVSLLKRAKSMDSVTVQERGVVSSPKDYLSSKKIIIIEQLKPSATPAAETAKDTAKKVTHSASNVDLKLSSSNADGYPVSNTVREYLKLFENAQGNVGGTTKLGKPVSTSLPPTKSVPVSTSLPQQKAAVPVSPSLPPQKSAVPVSTSLPQQKAAVPVSTSLPPQKSAVPVSTSLPPQKSAPVPPKLNVNKSLVVIVNEQTLKTENPKPDIIKVSIDEPLTQPVGSSESQSPSVKKYIDTFSKFQTSKPSYPSANTVENINVKVETTKTVVSAEIQKPIGSIIPFQREPKKPIFIEEEPTPPTKVPKVVLNHSPPPAAPATIETHNKTLVNGVLSSPPKQPPTSRPPVQVGNTVIIDFRGDDSKPSPPHLPTIEKSVPSYVPQLSRAIAENDASDDDDDDDVIVNMQDTKAVNFIGANIIVGRSSLLKSRNKKLQILFDDKAISTYEYPSEWTLLNERSDFDEWEDPNSNDCDNNEPNITSRPVEPAPDYDHVPKKPSINMAATSGGGLDHYTPMALSNEHVFELGISRAPQQPTVNTSSSSSQTSTVVDGQADDNATFQPAADNALWSRSQTSDLLF